MSRLSEADILDIIKSNRRYIEKNDWDGFLSSLRIDQRSAVATFILERTTVPLLSRLKTIPSYMFMDAEINGITIPGNIKSIGECAFKGSKIETVQMEDGVEFLGKECFANCYDLRAIDLADTITDIPRRCFSGDVSLEKVFLPDGVRTIGSEAFLNCEGVAITANFRDKDKIRAKKADYEFLKQHLKFTH